jgi:hypothetical protein
VDLGQKENGKVARKTEEDYKKEFLAKIENAHEKGVSKSALCKSKSSEEKVKAFTALQKTNEIADIGTKQSPRWVLPRYKNQPFEIAYNHVEKKAKESKELLISKNKLIAGLKGRSKNEFDEALRILAQEKKIIKLKAAISFLYIHIDRLIPFMPEPASLAPNLDEPASPAPNPDELRKLVMDSYQKVKQRFHFSDIWIFELYQEAGLQMDVLKNFLLKESREGRAVLSYGDWSLSSDEIHTGAIEINGDQHLMVRFL